MNLTLINIFLWWNLTKHGHKHKQIDSHLHCFIHLQALLGAPESDIDLLIRTGDSADGKYATLGRSPGNNAERVKFLHVNEPEDAGFQEGDYDSDDGDSMSDSNESYISSHSNKHGADHEAKARLKRM